MQNIESTENREVLSLPTKRGISLEDLYSEAQGIQSLCEDFTVSKASDLNMRFSPNSGTLLYFPDDSSVFRSSGMTRYAMSQLCNKLGIPIRYLEKCINSGMTDLASENINSWLQNYNKNLFIREYNNQIRGILSDRYMTLDTPNILEVLSSVVDSSDYTTKGYFISPERFHIRLVQKEMLNIAGEDLFAGIQIDSSDVGRSTLTARFMIFKQVCTNGLCISKGSGVLFEQKHIGLSVDEFHREFRESMVRIPEVIDNTIELIEKSRTLKLKEFSEAFRNQFKIRTGLSNESVDKVLSVMNDKYSNTHWGLINSITEVAQDFTLERRVELEKIAGEMLLVA